MKELWRATRWPLSALAVAGLLFVVAVVLDARPPGTAHELSLTIGAPALLLAVLALLWLLGALAVHWRKLR
ncbi:hypothetical protein ABJI51_40800 [Amycolatopsis sp. NEAU-NG30]|uniref:DUF1049 domain-containing protein n=1 Tax=Amycolatopsis melonis TaxID=3156488 RepID=A0ABV0LT44_9PSEU